jgi:hypothetical protein
MSTLGAPAPSESALVRTRLAWMRTALATTLVGFLLVRGWLTNSEPWILALLAGALSVLIIWSAVTRFTALGRPRPATANPLLLRLVSTGIAALAGVALIRLVLSA